MKQGEHIPIDHIQMDGGTQPRAALDFEAIYDYADAMEDGVKFPPVTLFYDGERYWLADGFHRVKAAFAAGHDTIECEIHQGTLEDAQWYSLSANRTNGLRRTNADKQRAVRAALRHSHGVGLSDNQIARHLGVDVKTVGNWREKLTMEIPQSTKRTGRDGRTINVTKIGKTASRTEPAAEQPVEPIDSTCATCGEVFSAPVWHCDTCGHHWPTGQTQCPNCFKNDVTEPSPCADAGDGEASEWCKRVHRASAEIAECPVRAKDLAAAIRCSNNSNQLTRQLEKTRDFIAAVLAEAGID